MRAPVPATGMYAHVRRYQTLFAQHVQGKHPAEELFAARIFATQLKLKVSICPNDKRIVY